jgi:hypothetical protein
VVSVGEVTGVVLAIVPPTPVLLVGDFRGALVVVHLPVIEHVVGGTLVVGLMSAGLCGDGMPMMKGMLLPDAALSLRCGGGEAACALAAPVLEAAEPARERGRSGVGIVVSELLEGAWERLLLEMPRRGAVAVVRSGNLRPKRGVGSSGSRVGEFRIASAITLVRGGVGGPWLVWFCVAESSYSPY